VLFDSVGLNFAARVDVDCKEAEKLFAVHAINIIRDFSIDNDQAEEAELLVEVRSKLDFVAVEPDDKLVLVKLVD